MNTSNRHSTDNQQVKLAVVILNWNGVKFLQQFLPSVVGSSQMPGVQVYVADNGSTDTSLQLLDSQFPQVRQIRLDRNYGFAGGYNKALQHIEAEYFILLNSDVEVHDGWLQPLIDFMDAHPDAAACAPKLLDYNQKERFEYAGAAGGFIDRYGYPFCRGRILNAIETDQGQYDQPTEVFWASGACMMLRAKHFNQVGGLDDRFFAHMEEIDLCWRFHNNGYQVWAVPQASIYHVGGGTLPNNNPNKLFLNYRNSLFMLCKNLETKQLASTLAVRLLLDCVSAASYFLTFKFNFGAAVFRAHFAFFANLRKMRASSKKIETKKIKKIPTIYKKLILIDFFVLKHRKFNQLRKFLK